MKTRIRVPALCLPAVVICCWLPGVTVAAASTVAPLPASNYTVRPVCAAPAPGYASCLALRLVPVTAAARAHTHPLGMIRNGPIRALSPTAGDYGLRPQDLHSSYALPTTASSPQTIAIVDAYNDLGAEADLKVYDEEFKLPECTEVNKCFKKVNQKGETGNLPFPQSKASRTAEEVICKTAKGKSKEAACKEVEEADGWAFEISLDIETAHAVCQNCQIVLVEANSATFPNLEAAENTAANTLGATEISNSWGGPELGTTPAEDDASAFKHPGIVIAAAAGDNGYLDWSAEEGSVKGFADYPASSPHVVAVGGTRLNLTAGGVWKEETVWNGSGAGGGGCSTGLTAPTWQQSASDWLSVGCGEHRAVADVSADADPYTGVAVYDSTPASPTEPAPSWTPLGGTSLVSPLVASVFALAGGSNGVEYPAQTLYENLAASPQSLHDVELGSNGECSKPFNEETGISGCTELQEAAQCSGKAICLAGPGYDGPSGVGTPNGITAFQPLTEEAKKNFEERKAKEKQVEEQKRKEKIEEEEERRKSQSEGTTGVQPNPNTTTSAGALTTATAPPTGSVQSPIVPLISGLALTRTAIAALNHGRPQASRVAFVFPLSAAARVRVTLAKRIRVRGRGQWKPLPGALTFAAIKGRNRRRLRSRSPLTPGHYRLTLTPQHGSAPSITFQVT